MSFQTIIDLSSPLNLNSLSELWIKEFEADTSMKDKVSQIFNNVICGISIYGIYAAATGETELVAYASYISMLLVVRKITSTMLGYLAYPAASLSKIKNINLYVSLLEKQLRNENFIVRNISLIKSGIKYDAILLGKQDHINNGNWTINALGNFMAMETFIVKIAKENFTSNSNTLFVNGPSVGESCGLPSHYQGFEVGIRFLEEKIQARRIIMRSFSHGGGMMAEAILSHDFTGGLNTGVRYLSISDRSFSRLSAVASSLGGEVLKLVFCVTGTELDGVGAATKLSQLEINQIIVQHISHGGRGTDSEIPDKVSLAYQLRKENIVKDKIFLESPKIRHNGPLPNKIQSKLQEEIKKFIDKG